jgi:hypothetical protein
VEKLNIIQKTDGKVQDIENPIVNHIVKDIDFFYYMKGMKVLCQSPMNGAVYIRRGIPHPHEI